MVKLKSKGLWLRVVVTLFVTLCPAIAQAQDDASDRRNLATDQAAYQRLLHAKSFNLGGAGFAVMMMSEEKALHVLLNSSNKIALFEQLVSQASPEGQLYGLYGLYLGDSQQFKEAAERLRNDGGPPERWHGFIFVEKGKIRFVEGCLRGDADRNLIIERMAKGDFDRAFKALSAQASPSLQVVTKPFEFVTKPFKFVTKPFRY